RRARRRDGVHDRASLPVRSQSRLLAVLARPAARRGRAVRARRHSRGDRNAAQPHPAGTRMTPALRTAGLSKAFGAFNAASDVSLAFPHGARHALIGPNGAGKTTLINLLTGVLAPSNG